VANWSRANAVAVTKYQDLITDMKASGGVDFAMLSLAVNEVHKLLRSDRPLAAGQ
jgi:NAD-specific glutamate dehydrogenase